MDRERLIASLEKGKQLGVCKLIDKDASVISYTYAVQKKDGRYIVFIDEYDINTYYEHELEDTEKVTVYDTLDEVFDNFAPKYGITPEDFCPPKGNKYFNPEFYRGL